MAQPLQSNSLNVASALNDLEQRSFTHAPEPIVTKAVESLARDASLDNNLSGACLLYTSDAADE